MNERVNYFRDVERLLTLREKRRRGGDERREEKREKKSFQKDFYGCSFGEESERTFFSAAFYSPSSISFLFLDIAWNPEQVKGRASFFGAVFIQCVMNVRDRTVDIQFSQNQESPGRIPAKRHFWHSS